MTGKKFKRKKKKKKSTIIVKAETEENEKEDEEDEEEEDEDEEEDIILTPEEQEIEEINQKISKKYPQTAINGSQNIWIIKPSGLSRGRGIKLYASLAEINHHLHTKDFSFIIQKYMENPMLYNKKKFDIRQWVLVTDWNPLTVLFFNKCYVRITTNEFTLANIRNRFIHLTNNSVNKKSKNFNKDDGLLDVESFQEWMDSEYYEGAYKKI